MTRIFQPSDERGMALPMAVFALVIIGALVAGIFFTGRIEQRSGTNGAMAAQAFETAEAGAAVEMAGWDYNALGIGTADTIARTSLGAKAAYQATVERLSENTFMLQVQGEQFSSTTQTDANLLSTRMVARLLKLSPTQMTVQAALLARGDVTIRGSSDLSGHNTVPPTWDADECEPSGDLLAIRTSGEISTNGSPSIEGAGEPPYEENATDLTDSTFMRPFNELKANADFTFPTGGSLSPSPSVYTTAPTVCNTDTKFNWGEPLTSVAPCQNYFPVILSEGNLRLNNGRGQGVLLVNGDLTLAGNFIFNGIIIATGTFDASHGTNVVHGAVFSSNAELDDMTLAGTPTVNFSACAVSRALNGAASVVPLAGRGWVQLY